MEMSIHFPGIGLDLPYIGKTVRIAGLEVSYYGILIGMGLVLALFFVVLETKRSHMDVNHSLSAMIGSIILGTVFARLYYVVVYWNLYKGNLFQAVNIRSGGMAVYGAIFGSILAIWITSILEKESFLKMADIFAIGALIAQAIGRWGDFFNRCSFGEYTSLPIAMQLPLSMVHSSEVTPLMRENLLTIDNSSYIQCQPAFLYESVWCLLLLLYLLFRRRRKLFNGEIFMRYLAGYGFGRFFIEYLRTDQMKLPGGILPFNMVISAVLFLLLMPVIMLRRSMTRKRNDYHRRRRERKYEIEEEVARAQEERDLLKDLKGSLADGYEEGYYASKVIPMEYGKARDEEELEEVLREVRDLHVGSDLPDSSPQAEDDDEAADLYGASEPEDGAGDDHTGRFEAEEDPYRDMSGEPEADGMDDDYMSWQPETDRPGGASMTGEPAADRPGGAFMPGEPETDDPAGFYMQGEPDTDGIADSYISGEPAGSFMKKAPEGVSGSESPEEPETDRDVDPADSARPDQQGEDFILPLEDLEDKAEELETETDPARKDPAFKAAEYPDESMEPEPTSRTFTFGDLLKQQKFPDPPGAVVLPWEEKGNNE